ncbi:hypothetical protein CEUSTIGMA_g5323.t1 [Chlamydomonas eustigma]|uniref:DOMON domain-containing protein n=1 Tax=Chlamydomonas eustigma TaxID=1157962 RepID=A0A250X485_9CHLO|nr:hypothetical protein CEUSTIGMA_g5323.t1 [Chlamydomonas eustigma]|eukprot:GAX77881.1 hypothetical protein CEUSTIGMA_g5323.t1 [Chlamydomonas eustigma]
MTSLHSHHANRNISSSVLQPPPDTNRTCTPSNLGYHCSLSLAGGTMVVHYWTASVQGGPAPVNNCTGTSAILSNDVQGAAPGMLHIAMQGATSGYVGVGFSLGSKMFNSDVVMGWTDCTAEGSMVRVMWSWGGLMTQLKVAW